MPADKASRAFPDLDRALERLARLGPLGAGPADGEASPEIWRCLLADQPALWQEALARAQGGMPVLVAPSHGGHRALQAMESLLAVALTLRGARVSVLLCDGALPACLMCQIQGISPEELLSRGPERICAQCYAPARRAYDLLGLPVMTYSQCLRPGQAAQAARPARRIPAGDLASFRPRDLPVGEHALAGALRYFARGDLNGEPRGEEVLRLYLAAALLTARAADNLLADQAPACMAANHGIYVPQGILNEACRRRGVRVVNWNPSYRKQTFIFSHRETYHHALLNEPVSLWEGIPWNQGMAARTMEYLESRRRGSRDWIWFFEKPREEVEGVLRAMGVDLAKPMIGLLSNVVWDAQLHYPANAFTDMLAWVRAAIGYFARRDDLQLVIRVHPAEVRGSLASRQPLAAEIKKDFPRLPPNVFVVGPESPVSTYSLMELCNAALIYGTKTGLELTSRGIPVIVGGEAWIRGKGLTWDASSPEEFFGFLDRLPLGRRLGREVTDRALRYAYHFFFRRMIPVACLAPDQRDLFRLKLDSLADAAAGSDPGLDVICRGIMRGEPFIFPAERLEAHSAGGGPRKTLGRP